MSKIYTRTGDQGQTSLYSGERVPKNSVIIKAIGSVDESNAIIGIVIASFPKLLVGISRKKFVPKDIIEKDVHIRKQHLLNFYDQLEIILSTLFDVGAAISTPRTSANVDKLLKTSFGSQSPKSQLSGNQSSGSRSFNIQSPDTQSSGTQSSGASLSYGAKCTQKLENWIDEMDAVLPPLKNFILPGRSLISAHLHHARTVVRRAERKVVRLIQTQEVEPEVGVYLNRLSDYLFVAARWTDYIQNYSDRIWVKQ